MGQYHHLSSGAHEVSNAGRALALDEVEALLAERASVLVPLQAVLEFAQSVL